MRALGLTALAGIALAGGLEAGPVQADVGRRIHARAVPAEVVGQVRGRAGDVWLLAAQAGQTVTVSMRSRHGASYFNVLAPGATTAMFNGPVEGDRFSAVAPVSGDYRIDVYLMRSAARRGEVARYRLVAQVEGLPGRPSASDARVAGTPFHATASIRCTPVGAAETTCEAGVVRREAGAGTVQVTLPGGGRVNVAFVGGQAVSVDTGGPLTVGREGDRAIVKLGDGTRLEIPDALVSGG